jgi:hypothetical protein
MSKIFNKQTFASFILGGLLFSGFISMANENLQIIPNPFPILVNGEKVDVEGYNINGSTYLKTRDTANILDADIDFKDKTIYIETSDETTSPDPQITPNESEVKPVVTTTTLKPNSTPDGITEIDFFEGKYYIGILYVNKKYKNTNYKLTLNTTSEIWQLKKDETILIENIPITITYGYGSIEYDYYINNVMPLLKESN